MRKTSTIVIIAVFIVIAILGIGFLLSHWTPRYTFYVSPDGDDNWVGSEDKPFRSISRVQEEIRELKKHGVFNQPVKVYIREGLYFLDKPIVFTPDDSGTEDYPIIYQAYPGEHPVLSGGVKLEDWYYNETLGVWITTPPTHGIQRTINQLFIDNTRYPRSRTEGYYLVDGLFWIEKDYTKFRYRETDYIDPSWAKLGNVEVVAFLRWTTLRMRIVDIDTEDRVITLQGKINEWLINDTRDARYYIENIPTLQQGIWYYSNDGKIYLKPPVTTEPFNPNNMDTMVSYRTQLILFNGDPGNNRYVSNIYLENLSFMYTGWSISSNGYCGVQAAKEVAGVISGEGILNCRIIHCRFAHIGGYAIEFKKGCRNNTIMFNEIYDCGAGGIKIGVFYNHWTPYMLAENELTMSNTVSDNRIHDIGEVYPGAVGILVAQSAYNKITHNEIYNSYYTGISIGWEWGYYHHYAHHNIVEYNLIYNIGRGLLSDMGGIYTLGVQPGTNIRNNIIHDVKCYDFGYGGWGLYADEGSSDIVFENNLVYNTTSGSFMLHYGRNITVENNILAYGERFQVVRRLVENHLQLVFQRNIIYWDNGELLGVPCKEMWRMKDTWSHMDNFNFEYNLYWDTRNNSFSFARTWSFQEWQNQGEDKHSLIENPLFEDPTHHNFNLQIGSPAFKLGFKPLNLEDIGVRGTPGPI